MLIEDSLSKVHNKFAFRLAKNTTIIKITNTKVDHTQKKSNNQQQQANSMALF